MNIDNKIIIAGYGGGQSSPRAQKEAGEGILTGVKPNTGIALSTTQIKVVDLLSEGEIHGIVTGEYSYSGILGNVGWSNITFTPNISAQDTNIKWLQSVYWNETPVVGKDGKYNFQQTSINYTKGSPNGSNNSIDNIIDELSVTRNISERLRGGGEEFAKIYRIIDRNCIGAIVNIRVNQLLKSSTDKKTLGDILVTSIDYNIYYRPIFSNKPHGNYVRGKSENINGKITAGYIRASNLSFTSDFANDDGFLGWEIKIVRSTEDSTTSTIRNQSFVDSLTELYGAKFVYPNSAIAYSTFNAEYFSNIPARTYDTQLLKVKVPSNYDPIYKTYNELNPWSGDFKLDSNNNILKEWTDNPVWCYYDILTNKRYGLGNYIDETYIDKFTLYEISKYCDTLVSDGYGGLEPRFTCNVYITSQDEAYKVVNALASVFRGITYYSAGQIYTSFDAQKTPLYQFTNANVLDGDFNYSSSAKKARHTVAIVKYNDKRNLFKPTVEYVENIDSIRKYGIREIEIPSFGATSRGQAIRHGRWALLTENLETESITFKVGIETIGLLRPGDVVQIFDAHKNGNRLGGRLSNIVCTNSNTSILLDSEISGLNSSSQYKLSLLTPSYYYDPSLVTGLTTNDTNNIKRSQIQYLTFNTTNVATVSGKSQININQSLDFTGYHVSGNYIWMVEATGNNVIGDIKSNEWETYRIINIREQESNIFEIAGLQYDVNKFLQVESGFSFTDSPATPSISFASPSNLQLTSLQISPHSKQINYKFNISSSDNIQNFRVLSKTSPFLAGDEYSGVYIIDTLPKTTLSGQYLPSNNSTYYFRVYSIGTNNILSNDYASNSVTIDGVNPVQDVTISSLQLLKDNNINNNAGTTYSEIYSTDSPTFSWQAGINENSNIPSDISYRITIRKPSSNNIPDKEIYYELTGYKSNESIYTFPFDDNYSAVSNQQRQGPFRDYDIVVESMTTGGYSSAGNNFVINGDADYSNPNGYDILYANNPQPKAMSLWTGDTTTILGDNTVAFYSTGYATQQWITQDGEIKIYFTISGNTVPLSGFFGDDIAGGTIFYSDYPFDINEAQGKIPVNPANKVIKSGQITSNNNPIIYPANLINKDYQYISIAPFDSFDQALDTQIYNYLVSGINASNVVKIRRNSSSQSYKAWVEFDIGFQNNQWGLINNWLPKSYNIKSMGSTIKQSDQLSHHVGRIVFENPMNTDYYGLFISTYQISAKEKFIYPHNVDGYSDYVNIIEKDATQIILPPFDKLFGYLATSSEKENVTGRCFIGITEAN